MPEETVEDQDTEFMPVKTNFIIDFLSGREIRETPEEIRRQEIARRLVEEWDYPKDLIKTEAEIQFGQNKVGRVDLVVFHSYGRAIANENAYIIVEVKRDSIREGREQLESYMNASTAEFGIWYNGKDIYFLKRLRDPLKFKEISKIPKYGEKYEELDKQPLKSLLKPIRNLKTRFDEIHNYLYANEGFLKEKLFGEIIKLIFMKIVDERQPSEGVEFWISEKEYQELVNDRQSDTFERRMERLWELTKNSYPEVDGELSLKISSVAEVVRNLQDISFARTQDDIKGAAFQTFIHENMRGDRGEFFTPQPAIELAVKMINPDYNETIIDPACGTGRFLIEALEIIKKRYNLEGRGIVEYARTHLAGVDINSDLIKVAKMQMVLLDDGWSNLFEGNSLLPIEQLNVLARDFGIQPVARPENTKYDIVLTNPPFGSRGKVKNSAILGQYQLARRWKFSEEEKRWNVTNDFLKEQTPEILFIERCWQLLKFGGRMAIVLPDGILTNASLQFVRQWILDNNRILAIVSLPQETFIPFGAGVKSSILLLEKRLPSEIENLSTKGYEVFGAIVEKIGYDVRGNPVFKRNENGDLLDRNGQKTKSIAEAMIDQDIDDIICGFSDFKKDIGVNF